MIVALLVLAVVVLLAIAARLIAVRMRHRAEEVRELPPLVYPARRVSAGEAEAVRRELAIRAGHEQVTFDSSDVGRTPAPPTVDGAAPASDGAAPASGHEISIGANGHHGNGAGPAAGEDVTLQLLPGRLEPADPGTEQEIRFVRLAGERRFTLGRNTGPAHSHIQLNAATASRMHAFMEFDGARWRLGNMSRTNRVVVNGDALGDDAVHVLADGDRVEFGELVFVFRAR